MPGRARPRDARRAPKAKRNGHSTDGGRVGKDFATLRDRARRARSDTAGGAVRDMVPAETPDEPAPMTKRPRQKVEAEEPDEAGDPPRREGESAIQPDEAAAQKVDPPQRGDGWLLKRLDALFDA